MHPSVIQPPTRTVSTAPFHLTSGAGQLLLALHDLGAQHDQRIQNPFFEQRENCLLLDGMRVEQLHEAAHRRVVLLIIRRVLLDASDALGERMMLLQRMRRIPRQSD